MKIRTIISFLIVLSIVSILTPLTSSAQDASVYMYWADHGNGTNEIRRSNLDGTNVQDIATGFGRPVGIALDLPGDKIYWTDRDNVDYADPNARNSIRRMNLDRTNIETLVIGGPSVKEAIALDTAGGKMYWVDWNVFTGGGKIQRANLNGTNVEDVVSELVDPRGIALDLSRGKMYWTDGGAGKIQRANLDGSNIEDIVTGLGALGYIALDFSNGKIYWGAAGKIQRANFDGSNVEDFVVILGHAIGIALDSLNGKIYWAHWFTNFQGSKIQRANLDGSNVEDLITGVGLSVGIALGIPQASPGSDLRFNPNVIADQTFTVGTYVNLTLPTATGGIGPYTYTLSPPTNGLQLDPATRELRGVPITDMDATPVTYTATDAAGGTISLTFDITVTTAFAQDALYMYWTDSAHVSGTPKIQRATLDGSNVENLVPEIDFPVGIALDLEGGKMYWTDNSVNDHPLSNATNRVRRANLDGTNIEILVSTTSTADTYFDIALDTAGGKMYWVVWSTVNGGDKIQRANLDGTNVEDIVILSIEGSIWDGPRGIALELSQQKIYWANPAAGKIQRANLDGTNVEDILTGFPGPHTLALDTSHNKIYWGNWERHKIQRANLDGTNIEDIVNTPYPIDIELDIPNGKMYWGGWDEGKIHRANLDGSNVEDLVTGLGTPWGLALGIPQPIERIERPILSLSPSPVQSPAVGQQLTLDLNITGGENVAGYQTTVHFDATALRYISSANADYLPAGAFSVPVIATENTVTVAATSLAGESAGDGTLATLTFEVIAAKASTLTLSDALITNADGYSLRPQVEAGQITEPKGLREDINQDGVVNIQDLVLVAANFGQTGENAADVNSDGVVNIIDLTLVAGALGNTAAAPSVRASVLEHLTATEVQEWLQAARQVNLTDATFQRGLQVLAQLLSVLVPKETALLPNYPNPFNPETWIPYQLAIPADVTLRIYAVDGSLVRTLTLGHQVVGMYHGRGRAVYWDGKNEMGEPVASGVYFYTLTAGDFNATRKMVIAK